MYSMTFERFLYYWDLETCHLGLCSSSAAGSVSRKHTGVVKETGRQGGTEAYWKETET